MTRKARSTTRLGRCPLTTSRQRWLRRCQRSRSARVQEPWSSGRALRVFVRSVAGRSHLECDPYRCDCAESGLKARRQHPPDWPTRAWSAMGDCCDVTHPRAPERLPWMHDMVEMGMRVGDNDRPHSHASWRFCDSRRCFRRRCEHRYPRHEYAQCRRGIAPSGDPGARLDPHGRQRRRCTPVDRMRRQGPRYCRCRPGSSRYPHHVGQSPSGLRPDDSYLHHRPSWAGSKPTSSTT